MRKERRVCVDGISFLPMSMKLNSNYEVKNTLSHTKAKTLVLVGSKERPIMKKSATKIVHLIPNSELEVLQGYYHGDI